MYCNVIKSRMKAWTFTLRTRGQTRKTRNKFHERGYVQRRSDTRFRGCDYNYIYNGRWMRVIHGRRKCSPICVAKRRRAVRHRGCVVSFRCGCRATYQDNGDVRRRWRTLHPLCLSPRTERMVTGMRGRR